MKFNWFHLMPYRYLPDNFKEEEVRWSIQMAMRAGEDNP